MRRRGERAAAAMVVVGCLGAALSAGQAATVAVRPAFRLAPEVGFTVHADGFGEPRGLLVSPAGDLYVADARRNEVVRITREGRREVVARDVMGAHGTAMDPLGMLYVAARSRNQVIKVSPQNVATVYLDGLAEPVELAFNLMDELLVCEAGSGAVRVFSSPRRNRLLARVEKPFGLVVTRQGMLVVVENGAGRILRIHPDGRIERFSEGLQGPEGIALGPSGDLYVAEPGAGRLSRIRPDGSRQTMAEGLSGPRDPAFDAYGQLFVAETGAGRVLRFTGDL